MSTRAVLIAVLALALAGCAEAAPTPMPLPTSSPTPSASATQDPNSIEAKRLLFDETNAATIEVAGGSSPGGRAFIDGLVAAGFDKAAMEVTPDRTAISLDADNIQLSVLYEGECLVAQYGNVGYQSAVLPVLATGNCLVGKTRTIDW